MAIQDLKQRPVWLKKRYIKNSTQQWLKQILQEGNLKTVCVSAICPNQNECFSRGHLTFLLLGDICTRNCSFCGVRKARPSLADKEEPEKIARAVKMLGLSSCIITSVTRDDIPDGGAGHFAKTVSLVRRYSPKTAIEVLVPDFAGDNSAVSVVISARPDLFAHNIETVPRLYQSLRSQADYSRSLRLILQANNAGIVTKSSIMVGLGEDFKEVVEVMQDLKKYGCQALTVGQYLRPTIANAQVEEYIHPETFKQYERIAKELGFKYILCGPFVRSSSMAIDTKTGGEDLPWQ